MSTGRTVLPLDAAGAPAAWCAASVRATRALHDVPDAVRAVCAAAPRTPHVLRGPLLGTCLTDVLDRAPADPPDEPAAGSRPPRRSSSGGPVGAGVGRPAPGGARVADRFPAPGPRPETVPPVRRTRAGGTTGAPRPGRAPGGSGAAVAVVPEHRLRALAGPVGRAAAHPTGRRAARPGTGSAPARGSGRETLPGAEDLAARLARRLVQRVAGLAGGPRASDGGDALGQLARGALRPVGTPAGPELAGLLARLVAAVPAGPAAPVGEGGAGSGRGVADVTPPVPGRARRGRRGAPVTDETAGPGPEPSGAARAGRGPAVTPRPPSVADDRTGPTRLWPPAGSDERRPHPEGPLDERPGTPDRLRDGDTAPAGRGETWTGVRPVTADTRASAAVVGLAEPDLEQLLTQVLTDAARRHGIEV
ncbi:hypothetical protein [Cellulomonas soli]|uniref:Uncharacterized protein n=1 Tax=Cellulomonas soli TaxID=931535 RepID=A0A512PHP4_9CELL|nr:hypothetical protein [Cellulomonas soli]NYI59198.1 hypothetical protein [Cellulomonas soli]GEP70703.1 hypothetical protein CSO01_34180 [Cellulomonas soli]